METKRKRNILSIDGIDRDLFRRFRALAVRRGLAVGELVNRAMVEYIARHEPDDSLIYEHPPIGRDTAVKYGLAEPVDAEDVER